MPLEETYDKVLPCVVAFIQREVPLQEADSSPPVFPPIFGTGFFVNAKGIVATNRHVVELFSKLIHPISKKSLVAGVLFVPGSSEDDRSNMRLTMVSVEKVAYVEAVEQTGPGYYGEPVPDVGFVQLKVKSVPFLELSTQPYFVRPGMSIATAGFPLGTFGMTPYGKASQATPFLRRGIISSVFPFTIKSPHGFTIDILQQGGSSGSPIFRLDRPDVVGMMASSMLDYSTEPPQNTNISYCVPSTQIKHSLDRFEAMHGWEFAGIPTLEEHLGSHDAAPFGLGWETHRIEYEQPRGDD